MSCGCRTVKGGVFDSLLLEPRFPQRCLAKKNPLFLQRLILAKSTQHTAHESSSWLRSCSSSKIGKYGQSLCNSAVAARGRLSTQTKNLCFRLRGCGHSCGHLRQLLPSTSLLAHPSACATRRGHDNASPAAGVTNEVEERLRAWSWTAGKKTKHAPSL